jgi:hypothetical protein
MYRSGKPSLFRWTTQPQGTIIKAITSVGDWFNLFTCSYGGLAGMD